MLFLSAVDIVFFVNPCYGLSCFCLCMFTWGFSGCFNDVILYLIPCFLYPLISFYLVLLIICSMHMQYNSCSVWSTVYSMFYSMLAEVRYQKSFNCVRGIVLDVMKYAVDEVCPLVLIHVHWLFLTVCETSLKAFDFTLGLDIFGAYTTVTRIPFFSSCFTYFQKISSMWCEWWRCC